MEKQKFSAVTMIALTLMYLIFNSCKKNDSASTLMFDAKIADNFFSLPSETSAEVTRIVDKLKLLNSQTNFIQQMAEREGYAVWNKVLIKTIKQKGSAKNSSSGNSDTLIYIPLVLKNTNYVNSFVYAQLNGNIILKLFRGNDYIQYGFDSLKTNNANNLATQIMLLNEKVFNHTEFIITDNRLFKFVNNRPTLNNKRVFLKDPAKKSSKSKSTAMRFESSMMWVTHYGCGGSVSPCTSSYCDLCSQCSYTTMEYVSYFVDDDSPSGNGGNPPGGGGGGSTGISIIWIPGEPIPCNPTPLIENGYLPCPDGNTSGWMPAYTAELFDPYLADSVIVDTSISNNYPCLQNILDTISFYSNLNQNAQLALKQIFNVNKRIHTSIELDRTLIGTTTSAYTRRTGTAPFGSDLETLDFSATIYVNPDILINATKEYVVATMVHEAMHAYINYIFTLYNQGYILPADSNYIKSQFPIFWGRLSPNSPPSEIQQHNLIANNWVSHVSAPLYAFTNDQINPLLKDSIYKALGWGGLEDTDVFKIKTDKCNIMAINIAGRYKNQGTPFTIAQHPECTTPFNVTAQNLKLKNLCD